MFITLINKHSLKFNHQNNVIKKTSFGLKFFFLSYQDCFSILRFIIIFTNLKLKFLLSILFPMNYYLNLVYIYSNICCRGLV